MHTRWIGMPIRTESCQICYPKPQLRGEISIVRLVDTKMPLASTDWQRRACNVRSEPEHCKRGDTTDVYLLIGPSDSMSLSLSYRNKQPCSTKDSYPRSELDCRKRTDSRTVHHQRQDLSRVAVQQEDMQQLEQAVLVRNTRCAVSLQLIPHQAREHPLLSHKERKSVQHLTVRQVQSFQD